ncbi:uncharacterized protein LOC129591806 [Paramacrobiotus metropolitanus]|uniref:uncharacterized protein LOC129591806 n=1 Tax=Paramacrobiotus metropolitanus TaxID=2943436 RepID=UPI00244572EF|nr:uncharacterized protein LOC129591806 [Paramacrobiotus metropolitanus]
MMVQTADIPEIDPADAKMAFHTPDAPHTVLEARLSGNTADTLYDAWDAELEAVNDSALYFQPQKGNVIFASALDGWGFTSGRFAELFAKKLGLSRRVLNLALWGDFWLDEEKRIKKNARARGKEPLFVQLVLDNLWQMYDAVGVRKDKALVEKMTGAPYDAVGVMTGQSRLKERPAALGLTIDPRDLRLPPKTLIFAICSQWLPLGTAVLWAVYQQLQSPAILLIRPTQDMKMVSVPTDGTPLSAIAEGSSASAPASPQSQAMVEENSSDGVITIVLRDGSGVKQTPRIPIAASQPTQEVTSPVSPHPAAGDSSSAAQIAGPVEVLHEEADDDLVTEEIILRVPRIQHNALKGFNENRLPWTLNPTGVTVHLSDADSDEVRLRGNPSRFVEALQLLLLGQVADTTKVEVELKSPGRIKHMIPGELKSVMESVCRDVKVTFLPEKDLIMVAGWPVFDVIFVRQIFEDEARGLSARCGQVAPVKDLSASLMPDAGKALPLLEKIAPDRESSSYTAEIPAKHVLTAADCLDDCEGDMQPLTAPAVAAVPSAQNPAFSS